MPIVGDVNDSLPLTLAGSSHLLATTDDHKSLEIFSMNDEFFATNLTTKLPPLADIYKSAFDDVSFRQNKLRQIAPMGINPSKWAFFPKMYLMMEVRA